MVSFSPLLFVYLAQLYFNTAVLYPNGVSGSSWLYQGSNFYGMTVSTSPIFANVPAGRTNKAPVVRLQGKVFVVSSIFSHSLGFRKLPGAC